MIRELICYKCTCSKCSHTWTTKSHELPLNCAKCKTKRWNDDYDFSLPLPVPELVEPIAFTSETEAVEPEPLWIELPPTRENGEILYWHKKLKGNPICYRRETDWDTFA